MVKNKRKTFKKLEPLILAAFLCAFLIYGNIIPKKACESISLFPLENTKIIDGKIISNPQKLKNSKYYICSLKLNSILTNKAEHSEAKGTINVKFPEELIEAYFPGKVYSSFKAKAEEKIILLETGAVISAEGNFSKDNKTFTVSCLKKNHYENSLEGKICFIRAVSRLKFRRLMYFWKEAGGLFLALLSGIKEYTDSQLSENFKIAGLSHILALSGMHLSLFSGLVKKSFGKNKNTLISQIFQLGAASIFVWFAGLSPSLLRAFLCSIIGVAFSLLKVKNSSLLKILSVSFLVHAIIAPLDLYKLSFMLSYGALAGIIISGTFFSKLPVKKLPFMLSQSLGASSGAQTFTAPVTLKAVGALSPIGIISSVVVSPLITIFIYSGLLILLLSIVFPFFAPYGAYFMKILYNLIKMVVFVFSKAPVISIN